MQQAIEYTCNSTLFPKPYDILCYNQFIVEECIELPDHKPNIQKIIDVKITPEIALYKLIDSPTGKKVFIRGHLEQEIIYIVDSLCQPVHAFLSVSPFCTFIDLDNCNIYEYGMLEVYTPKILVEYMETVHISCRTIRKCVLLFIWYPKGIITPKPPQPYTCHPKAEHKSCCKVSKPRLIRKFAEE